MLGPENGSPHRRARLAAPVLFQDVRVAELAADGCPEPSLLGQVAPLLAPYCLVGWDTGGVPWDESA